MRWTFEPGHTSAEFRARHMMVTWVRGHFKNVRGHLEFDPREPERSRVEVEIDARGIWTGEPQRDDHLRSADFLDVENHPIISFRSSQFTLVGENEFRVAGTVTIRGVSRPVDLEVRYLGQWRTPYWVDENTKKDVLRAGFEGTTVIDRHDFGVSWNDVLDRGGVVVGDRVYITLDAEALHEVEQDG